jgi:hypothetical protein
MPLFYFVTPASLRAAASSIDDSYFERSPAFLKTPSTLYFSARSTPLRLGFGSKKRSAKKSKRTRKSRR